MSRDNWYCLPQNVNEWQTFVLSNLARKVPDIPKYIAGIEFSKMDPVLGDADGLVYLLGGMAAIPITVRQNKMAPLDVMVTKKEDFYPVSESFLQKIYADNVIGEPSKDPTYGDDEVSEGPAQRIQYYNTINDTASSAKYASELVKGVSYETKVALRGEIEKSAKALTFFNTHRPEVLETLYTAEPDPVIKIAAVEEDIPELMFLYKTASGNYVFNEELVTSKVAGDFMDAMGMTQEQRVTLMNQGHACFDYREKQANLVVNIKDGNIDEESVSEEDAFTNSFLAEVMDVRGNVLKGMLYKEHTLGKHKSPYRYIFVCTEGYAVQNDLLILNKVPIKLEHFMEVSTDTKPMTGMFGMVMSKFSVTAPFNVCAVQHYGDISILKSASYNMKNEEYTVDKENLFYETVDNHIELARNGEDVFNSVEGQNVSVSLNPEGKIVLASETYEKDAAIFELMDEYELGYEDAFKVANLVEERGTVLFKIAKVEKKETKKKDAKKKPAEKKAQPKRAQSQQAQPQQAQPQQQVDPQVQQDSQEDAAEQQSEMVMSQTQPVKQQDLDDIASLNNPSLMDAYITGKLTNVNTAGREQIMQASDAIVGAIKAVGKILFLVRQGKLDYVNENDAQLALNKLADVAKDLGVASSQLG